MNYLVTVSFVKTPLQSSVFLCENFTFDGSWLIMHNMVNPANDGNPTTFKEYVLPSERIHNIAIVDYLAARDGTA